eukprot:c25114_g3_i1 orf=8-259(-)
MESLPCGLSCLHRAVEQVVPPSEQRPAALLPPMKGLPRLQLSDTHTFFSSNFRLLRLLFVLHFFFIPPSSTGNKQIFLPLLPL